MASQSRGQIEELSVTFNNETEKSISFLAGTGNNVHFSAPPVVKIISIDGNGQDDGNANIGVTFTDISISGMKIITSARFTGTIRYLCSVQG